MPIWHSACARYCRLPGDDGAVATGAGAELLEAKKGGNGKGRGKGRGRGRGNGNGGNGNGNGGGGDNGKKRTICHCPPGDPDNCHTIRVGRKAAESHLRNHSGDSAGPCNDDGQDQCLPVTDTEGDATEESNGEFTLTTEGDDDFGNLIGNPDQFVWIDDLCGGTSQVTTYEDVLADYGDEVIESIVLVVDESPQPGVTEKTVTVDVCISVASS